MAYHSSYTATRPSIFRLPCEQFDSAKNLRFQFEQTHPPCEFQCATLSFDCGIKRLLQHTGADFRFYNTMTELNRHLLRHKSVALTIELIANLPRCAAPVASYLVRYKIQHTSCLSSCGLLNVTSRPCQALLANTFCNATLLFCANSRTM